MHQKTQNHFLKFSIHLSVRKSRENYRQIYGKSKASLWRNLSTGTPPKFFNTILCFVALSLQLIFLSEQPFYGNYSTLDSHTNTAIFHAFAYSSRWHQKLWQGLYCNYLLTTMQGDRSHVCLTWLTRSLDCTLCIPTYKHAHCRERS